MTEEKVQQTSENNTNSNPDVQLDAPPTTQPETITKSKRPLLALLIVAVLAVAGCAYWFMQRRDTQPETTTTTQKINIGNVGEFSIFNIIAQDQGYFTQNNLEASVKEYDSGATSIAGLQSGEVDVAVAADFVGVVNIFKDPSIRILSQASEHQSFRIVARKDKGITKISDLKGKKIGVTKKSAGEYFLGQFLNFNNIATSDLTVVDLAPPDMVKSLEEDDIDAALIFNPHAYNLIKKLADNSIDWSAQGSQSTYALFYTRDNYAAQNSDVLSRYMKALIAAETFAHDNPDQAKTIISQRLKYDKAYVDYMWPNFEFGLKLGQELPLNMESQARWAITNKLTDKKELPNYLDYIHFPTLEQNKPDAITITH